MSWDDDSDGEEKLRETERERRKIAIWVKVWWERLQRQTEDDFLRQWFSWIKKVEDVCKIRKKKGISGFRCGSAKGKEGRTELFFGRIMMSGIYKCEEKMENLQEGADEIWQKCHTWRMPI